MNKENVIRYLKILGIFSILIPIGWWYPEILICMVSAGFYLIYPLVINRASLISVDKVNTLITEVNTQRNFLVRLEERLISLGHSSQPPPSSLCFTSKEPDYYGRSTNLPQLDPLNPTFKIF